MDELKDFMSACRGLMHSYHNVAELRQFRGGADHESDRSPAAFRLMARWSRRL